MMFDVKDFYPTITEKLLKNAIQFANSISQLEPKEKEIVFHSRKSLLFHEREAWLKKGNKLFDVTRGAYDGAEVCELVGCFLLHKLSRKYNKDEVGLYRDDGLGVFRGSAQQNDSIRKDFVKIFKTQGLDIIAECNMKVVHYLDVTLDLNTGTYKPFTKPDSEKNYVHIHSNHPPNIIKQIPKSIETHLSNLSSNEDIFNNAKPIYAEALERSGYTYNFTYNPNIYLFQNIKM